MRELRILDEKIKGIHECPRFVEVNVPFQWEVWCEEYYPEAKEREVTSRPGAWLQSEKVFSSLRFRIYLE